MYPFSLSPPRNDHKISSPTRSTIKYQNKLSKFEAEILATPLIFDQNRSPKSKGLELRNCETDRPRPDNPASSRIGKSNLYDDFLNAKIDKFSSLPLEYIQQPIARKGESLKYSQ